MAARLPLSAAANPAPVARAIISIRLLAWLLAALLRHLLHPVKKKKEKEKKEKGGGWVRKLKAQSTREALGFSAGLIFQPVLLMHCYTLRDAGVIITGECW